MAAGEEWEWGFPPPPPLPPGASCDLLLHCPLEGGPLGATSDRAALPPLPLIAVCSSIVLVALLVASFLIWRHKTKVQNLLPSKADQPGVGGAANGVSYEDTLHHHPSGIPQGQTLMPLEILDLKLGTLGPPQISSLHHPPCYPPRDAGNTLGSSKSINPVYEEVVPANNIRPQKTFQPSFQNRICTGRNLPGEGDFPEDEYPSGEGSGQCSATSSVRGSTGGDLCRDQMSSEEDCDFMVSNLPEIVPGSYGYHRKQGGRQDNRSSRNQMRHQHPVPSYPLPERTYRQDVPERTERMNGRLHSKPAKDSHKHMSPPTIPSPFVPHLSSAQWLGGGQSNFPTSPSQENIYSTIDEDEMEYPIHPPLPSLARGSPSKQKTRGDRANPPLSQRNADENGGSYGDMLPAYNSAAFL